MYTHTHTKYICVCICIHCAVVSSATQAPLQYLLYIYFTTETLKSVLQFSLTIPNFDYKL